MIYFNLFIPVIAIIVLLIFFRHKMAIWEYALVFFIPLIAIIIAKCVSVGSQTFDTEIYNAYLVRAEYIEPYTTWVHRTCQRSHTTCTGSGSNRTCHTTYTSYDCSYCDRHGPSWIAYDNMGRSHSISQSKFESLSRIWGNRSFVDLNRNINYHFGCGQDGDKYVTVTDNKFENIQPVTTEHTYTNKVQASRSVFNFQKVDTSDIHFYGLFTYPKVYDPYNYNPILGWSNAAASKRLAQWNAMLGSRKQVHMMILVFPPDKSIDAAMYQESFWKGGNKNEFILCIGLKDSKTIAWTKTISWTEIDRLKLDVEKTVLQMPMDLVAISDTMANHVNQSFVRKSFKDFNYIKIEPTSGAMMWAFIITFVLTIGLCIFVIKNDIDN